MHDVKKSPKRNTESAPATYHSGNQTGNEALQYKHYHKRLHKRHMRVKSWISIKQVTDE